MSYKRKERRRATPEEEALGEESVKSILGVLSQIQFQDISNGHDWKPIIAGVSLSPKFSRLDKKGIDFGLILTHEFGELVGYEIVNVQSVSSECGVEAFDNIGKKKFGTIAQTWREWGLVVLNGSWSYDSIKVDFLIQLFNLTGILDNHQEVMGILKLMDEKTRNDFLRKKDLIEGYRADLLDWVAGKFKKENRGNGDGGLVTFIS